MGVNTVVDAARQVGFRGEDLVTAIAVALAESSGRPDAVNDENSNGSTDYGLWQINSVHTGSGFKPGKALDPEYNAKWARRLWEERGWQPWVAYNSGAYKNFLDQARAAVQGGGGGGGGNNGGGGDAPPIMPMAAAAAGGVDADDFDPSEPLGRVFKQMSELTKQGRAKFDGKGIQGLFEDIQGGGDDRAVERMSEASGLADTPEAEGEQEAVAEAEAEAQAADGGSATAAALPDGSETDTGNLAWGGHQNGRIAKNELFAVRGVHYSGSATHYFEEQAGKAFKAMIRDARKDGVKLDLTDSYRDYATQVRLKDEKGAYAATPGRSNHGWGKAIDVASDEARRWVQNNGAKYGWVWPSWAHDGQGIEEDWHFEFRPGSN